MGLQKEKEIASLPCEGIARMKERRTLKFIDWISRHDCDLMRERVLDCKKRAECMRDRKRERRIHLRVCHVLIVIRVSSPSIRGCNLTCRGTNLSWNRKPSFPCFLSPFHPSSLTPPPPLSLSLPPFLRQLSTALKPRTLISTAPTASTISGPICVATHYIILHTPPSIFSGT